MDTVQLLEGLSGQQVCERKKETNHYQSTWKHTACQLACPGVLYWFSPVPSFKSSNTTALLKAAQYLCIEATILDISSIYFKTPTQPPDFKVSFMETLVETHLARSVENTFQFWSWSELEMYWVGTLLPAWFCHLQFTQRVQVELKWNRPQLCLQLRCHTNKGKNHFKNTPHTTQQSKIKLFHSYRNILSLERKVLKFIHSWLLRRHLIMFITNNHRIGTRRRKGIVDICEHRYILHLRGSKLLSHKILLSNPEIAHIIRSWQGTIVEIQGCKRKHQGQELGTNASLSVRFRGRKVGRVSHSLRTQRVYITINSNWLHH